MVDDNPINRIVTRRLLDTIGCKSTVLESGQKCLDVLSEKGPASFHIILLDLCMPEVRNTPTFCDQSFHVPAFSSQSLLEKPTDLQIRQLTTTFSARF